MKSAQANPVVAEQGIDCFCEITQLEGEALAACQDDPSDPPLLEGAPVSGYCYVDATTSPPTGNPELVAHCPAAEQRLLRFVGAGSPLPGAVVFIRCEK